jgi:hypothetical protein
VSYLEYISETVTSKPIWTDFSFENIEKNMNLSATLYATLNVGIMMNR